MPRVRRAKISDYERLPYLQLVHAELANLVSSRLRTVTSDPLRDVEAVFLCALRQEAFFFFFLVAQVVYPDLYRFAFVFN